MALTNAQYDELIRKYQQKQWAAHRQAAEKKETIYSQLPILSKIDDQIGATSVRRAKEFIGGNASALANLDAEIASLSQEKQSILEQAGYRPDCFEPKYECPDCKDTGYINNKKCHCFLQAEMEYIYEQSNVKHVLERENFSKFSLDYYSQEMIDPVTKQSSYKLAQDALAKCRAFTTNFDKQSDNLLLYGKPGTGKTFLTNCIAKELLDAGHSVIYFSAFQLFDQLAKYAFDRNASENEYKNIFNCDLLIIDDLGTEGPNTFTTSKFFQCINERILRGKSTMISTNLTPKEIADTYFERISSRINSYFTMIKMFGQDIRIMKKLAGK